MTITLRQPFTPGEILLEEFMQPLNLSASQLARRMKVSNDRVYDILNQKRGITPDTAIRLSKVFGTSVDFWLNLQIKTDLWKALHDPHKKHEYKTIQRV
jgi:addiction module HigA family antidote